ncbi:MAG: hypothetical protein U0Z53_20535 [Blastocatellia bacterium]
MKEKQAASEQGANKERRRPACLSFAKGALIETEQAGRLRSLFIACLGLILM